MAKDKLFGAIIFAIGILLIVVYFFWGPLDLYFEKTGSYPAGLQWLYNIQGFSWEVAVVLPLFLAGTVGWCYCDLDRIFDDYHPSTSTVRRIGRRIRS